MFCFVLCTCSDQGAPFFWRGRAVCLLGFDRLPLFQAKLQEISVLPTREEGLAAPFIFPQHSNTRLSLFNIHPSRIGWSAWNFQIPLSVRRTLLFTVVIISAVVKDAGECCCCCKGCWTKTHGSSQLDLIDPELFFSESSSTRPPACRRVPVTDWWSRSRMMEELHDVQLTEIKPLLTGQVS